MDTDFETKVCKGRGGWSDRWGETPPNLNFTPRAARLKATLPALQRVTLILLFLSVFIRVYPWLKLFSSFGLQ
jgi:hypothetical protein